MADPPGVEVEQPCFRTENVAGAMTIPRGLARSFELVLAVARDLAAETW